jgi:acetyltransferase-like isoleucine patch superfamily enzyme
MLHRIRLFQQKLYWRLANYYAHRELRGMGVEIGRDVHLIGLPMVTCVRKSKIYIGAKSTLISSSHYTPLGINHPVVLRTIQPGARVNIGERVGISGGSICAAQSIEIGPDTLLGANVTVTDTDFHSLNPHTRSAADFTQIGVAPVKIGAHVFIGTNSVILKGVTIGDNSIIGAGSIVTKSIPANVIAVGNPCRVIRALTELELRPPQSC